MLKNLIKCVERAVVGTGRQRGPDIGEALPRQRRRPRPCSARPYLEVLETRLTPTYILSTLASFSGGPGGNRPNSHPVMDSSGNLYGTTMLGGANGYGVIYELAQGSSTITPLASFTSSTPDFAATSPQPTLLLDSSGNLYGATYQGGTNNDGTVYELAHGSHTLTTLASFNGTNGANPYSGLLMDGSGNLYGTARLGGTSNDGTLFELAHGSSTITPLVSFTGPNGTGPTGALMMDGSGNLYGTTQAGGPSNWGTVFEYTPSSGTLTVLASFNRPVNGGQPFGGVARDSSGNLYGGERLDATLYEVAAGSGTVTTLGPSPGGGCWSSLVIDASGNLFGTTSGAVFMIPHGSTTVTTLASVLYDLAGLMIDGSGNLYGTTGGANLNGTVFELQAAGVSLNLTTVPAAVAGTSYSQWLSASGGAAPYTFAVTAGALPAGLRLSADGLLSGTPTAAGAFSFSVTATDSAGQTGSQAYTLVVTPASFSVTGFPSPSTAGAAGMVTVSALDAGGNVLSGYQGTVHFTSSDSQAVLPADYTFTAADQGVHSFPVTLKTAGSQSITAADTANSASSGSEGGITITPGSATALAFSNVPASVTAGSVFTVTLMAKDAYGNRATGYTGTVTFGSSDTRAVLPANYTFTTADAGSRSFAVTLKTAGGQSVTASDTGGLTGTAGGIVVNPAAAAGLSISGLPATVRSGTAYTFTVTARDAYGNTATGYRGTVHFTSSDARAKVPASYAFTAGDNGAHTFTSGVKFNTLGTQTLTDTDTGNATITGSVTVQVTTTGAAPVGPGQPPPATWGISPGSSGSVVAAGPAAAEPAARDLSFTETAAGSVPGVLHPAAVDGLFARRQRDLGSGLSDGLANLNPWSLPWAEG